MRIKLIVIGLLYVLGVNAQITKSVPVSWDMQSKSNIAPMSMKSFDLNKIKQEDARNDVDKSLPWRFGYELKVDLGLNNSGVWDELPNGDRIWRINIVSKGAKTLNSVFDTYHIPEGATVHLYNNDKSDVLGAYTHVFNRPDQMMGTWFVEGDNVWIEYFEPANVRGQGKLNIAKIVHGYRSITDSEIREKAIGNSGDCNFDVNCSIEGFDTLKDKLKKSVGFIILGNFVCTGTLINNTSNDKAPYFLTANHCNGDSESTWAFRFNWISGNPSCGTTNNSTDTAVDQTTSGATLLASNPESDFKLLRLDGGLDPSWDLEWAGWDRTNDVPGAAVGIHHPSGDIMKVCKENNPLSVTKTDIGGIAAPVASWVVENWDLGVTEGGSSGSALFNLSGRIVGQLAGGGAACNGTNDNNQPDFYGRFNVSWDFGNSDSTRLSNWLDPTNTGRQTLDMLSVELLGGTPDEEEVILTFSPSDGIVKIDNTTDDVLEYIVYDISGKQTDSGRLATEDQQIDLTGKSSGMYFISITNTSNGNNFIKKVIINKL